jgi:hypothetical protein
MPRLIEPLADNDARAYQLPTSRITQPAIHDGRGVWNVYQAQGSSDYIMQDAADALMDYEMESSSGNDSPIRIHLATLHLRPVEGASQRSKKNDSTSCWTSTSFYLRKLDLRPPSQSTRSTPETARR